MKRKLYCFIGGCALAVPMVLFPMRESSTGDKVPALKVCQEKEMEESYYLYANESRARILSYTSSVAGSEPEYSSDLINSSVNKEREKKSEDSKGKGSKTDDNKIQKTGQDVSKKSKNKKDDDSSYVINLTKEEKETLLRIVEAEATGEDITGRMLVANVVLNRVKSDIFPDNVVDVVYAHSGNIYQFSPISDGRFWQVSISQETKKAVERVLKGEDYSNGALFFMARRSARQASVSWFDSHLTLVKQYGGHEFYK